VWAYEGFVRRPMKYGTPHENFKLVARIIGVSGAFANMTIQLGINMHNWIAPGSIFSWAGGPIVDYIAGARDVIVAPYDRKLAVAMKVPKMISRLALPGQVAFRDWQKAFGDGDDLGDAFMGITLGRPTKKSHMAMDHLFAPMEGMTGKTPEELMLGGGGAASLDTMGLPSLESLIQKFGVPDGTSSSASQTSRPPLDFSTLRGN
jgi:hypothetical protein